MPYRNTRSMLALFGVLASAACSAGSGPSGAAPTGEPLDASASGDAGAPIADAPAGASSDALPSFTQDELALLQTLSPASLPSPPADISNRFADNAGAAAFGQKLFFESAFSGKLLDGDDDGSTSTLGSKGQSGKVACAGCHVPSAGFLDDRTLGEQISLAAGWGKRRTPSLLDVGQTKLVMWDGKHDALYNQPFGPLENLVEMNSSRLYAAEQIFALYRGDYEAIFGAMPPLGDTSRFPAITADTTGCQPTTVDPTATCNGTQHGLPGDAEFDQMAAADQDAVTQVVVNMGKAIGAYERLLSCGPGRFDQWMHGQTDALTASEQRGAEIFVGRGKCVGCHSGPFLSDQQFHDVGLQPKTVAVVFIDSSDPGASTGVASSIADPLNVRGKYSDGDDGRLPSTVPSTMNGAFRTPILRCEARRPTFMHTGQLSSLAQVVAFFARGGDQFGYLGTSELAALSLSAEDQQDLTAFLGTLEGPGPTTALLTKP
jgi:cytochrome c peroxidase